MSLDLFFLQYTYREIPTITKIKFQLRKTPTGMQIPKINPKLLVPGLLSDPPTTWTEEDAICIPAIIPFAAIAFENPVN
jgi:hypothetical protein